MDQTLSVFWAFSVQTCFEGNFGHLYFVHFAASWSLSDIIGAEEQKESIMQEKLVMRHYDTVKVQLREPQSLSETPI